MKSIQITIPGAAVTLFFTVASVLLLQQAVQSQGPISPAVGPGAVFKTLGQVDPGQSIPSPDPGSPFFGAGPFSITNPGNYYLADNLEGSTGVGMILIQSPGVTLDMRGFRINGTDSLATGIAINVDDSAGTPENIVIKNGAISGRWNHSIFVDSVINLRVENVHIFGARRSGISVTGSATDSRNVHIVDCSIFGNEAADETISDGISLASTSNSIVERCSVANIAGKGIEMGPASSNPGAAGRIVDCVVSDTGQEGIAVDLFIPLAVLIKGCTVSESGSFGIQVNGPALIENCFVTHSGSSGISVGSISEIKNTISRQNGGNGFSTGSSSTILDCTAYANSGNGFNISSSSIASRCQATFNTNDGFLIGSGTNVSFCNAGNNGQPTAANGNTSNDAADGISMSLANQVHGCTIYNNEGVGLRAISSRNHIFDNHVYSNDSGGIDLASNLNAVINNYVASNSGFQIDLTGGTVAPLQAGSTATHPVPNLQ